MMNMKGVGKKSLEWDLNDWNWDGDLLRATPLNPEAFYRSSSQLLPLVPELQLAVNAGTTNSTPSSSSEETTPINENGTRGLEKKRSVVVSNGDELNDETGLLKLKLGEQSYPIVEAEVVKGEGKSGNKSNGAGTSHPVCQVEGCTADLSNGRDYHRRHKVCEMHSKATESLVANCIQRFCQQCSRFHALQEFDGGRRSCRRRLAGHNKRRRKTNPEASPNFGTGTETNAGQILNLLLRVLSSIHTNNSVQTNDQDLLSQVLRNLGSNTSRQLQGFQGSPNVGASNGIPEKEHPTNQEPSQTTPYAQRRSSTQENQNKISQTSSALRPKVLQSTGGPPPAEGNVQVTSLPKHMLGGIDLNNVYDDDSLDCRDNPPNGIGSVAGTYWAEQTLPSPPPTSGNTSSTSGRSSSSNGDAQCRTGRMVFKLFDKEPKDLPSALRTQILDWLSNSPTDIEGFIRPGCIVLTLYIRLNSSLWEQLCYDISSSLSRLLDVSNDPFWKTGWIYTIIQQRAAFICDGRLVLDTSLPFNSPRCRISSISPIALPAGETVQLVVRASHLSGPTSRLRCAIEGRYLVQKSCCLGEGTDVTTEQDDIQSLSMSCTIPNVIGRGFIEVEDYDLDGCFFPFIVAEPKVCYEICMLEREMELGGMDEGTQGEGGETDIKNQALEFVHEMGWLLHRNNVRLKENQSGSPLNLFPFERLKWLVEFSMDHSWCAVLRKLMDLYFSGIVDTGGYASIEDGLLDIALLHTAVRKNSRPMVEFLLTYVPKKAENKLAPELMRPGYVPPNGMLFRPDVGGAGGLTPLHIAASSTGLENVLDALLEDPGMVGIEAWKSARDNTGLTPCNYASLRGHYRYLQLVQRKTNQKSSGKHLVLDIPSLSHLESNHNQKNKLKSTEFDSFYTEKPQVGQSCKLCELMPDSRFGGDPLTFRPIMISLVAIAVVCVCTALLFKSEPQVGGILGLFRWETLKYGAM